MITVTVSEEIEGPAAAVWAALENFGAPRSGGGLKDFRVQGRGVGMTRTFDMGDHCIVERLDSHDPNTMTFAYSIVNEDHPLPVSRYSAQVRVSDAGGGRSGVQWVATFEPRGDEARARSTMEAVYRAAIARARKTVCG
ncbi:MAG: SRPBCC family protein [Gammaproteobacteria bacterium]